LKKEEKNLEYVMRRGEGGQTVLTKKKGRLRKCTSQPELMFLNLVSRFCSGEKAVEKGKG